MDFLRNFLGNKKAVQAMYFTSLCPELIHITSAALVTTELAQLVNAFVLVSLGSAGICEIGCGATCARPALPLTFKATPGPKPAWRIEKCTAEAL